MFLLVDGATSNSEQISPANASELFKEALKEIIKDKINNIIVEENVTQW